jgi:hypothetical protein
MFTGARVSFTEPLLLQMTGDSWAIGSRARSQSPHAWENGLRSVDEAPPSDEERPCDCNSTSESAVLLWIACETFLHGTSENIQLLGYTQMQLESETIRATESTIRNHTAPLPFGDVLQEDNAFLYAEL